jgi:nicotinamidase-related amidase
MSDPTDEEERAAALLAFALGARPERITDAMLASEPPEVKAAVGRVHETLAALALGAADGPAAPPLPEELRARIFETIVQKRRTPRAALVIIDMVNDHLRPGVALEVPRARTIVPALKARIARARAEQMPIVYVVDQHAEDDSDLDFVDGWGAHNVAGTAGAEVWSELAPESGDRVVTKPTYSAFTESNLSEVLDELRVDALVLTGCLTEIGLMATAKDALERGFAVDIPADSQAGSHPDLERSALVTLSAMAPYGPARAALLRDRGVRVA